MMSVIILYSGGPRNEVPPALSAEISLSVCLQKIAFSVIKLRNFFDFLRFPSNFTQIRPFRPKMAPFDVHFPPFVPKASTFRRGTPAGPPGSAPAYPRCPHEGCDPARRSLHLFTLRLFTPHLFTPHLFTPRLFTHDVMVDHCRVICEALVHRSRRRSRA